MTSEEADAKVIDLLEQIVARLENIDKKLSGDSEGRRPRGEEHIPLAQDEGG